MNWEAWKPLATLAFTTTLKFIGGLLVAHGLATQGPGLEALGGAATTAGAALWSWWVQKGHIQAADYLKKMTDTATQAAAIEVAKRMPISVAPSGAVQIAKAAATVSEPAVMAKDAAKAVILLAILVLGALAFPGDAMAQVKLVKPTGNIINDIAAAQGRQVAGVTGAPVTDAQNFFNAMLLPDLQYALKLAQSSKNTITADCYQAWIDIINTQQTAVLDTSTPPQPLPMPDPHIITEFEKIVELRNALQPESPFMVKCSPVASMVKKDITGFIGIVISGGAGLATLVPGL